MQPVYRTSHLHRNSLAAEIVVLGRHPALDLIVLAGIVGRPTRIDLFHAHAVTIIDEGGRLPVDGHRDQPVFDVESLLVGDAPFDERPLEFPTRRVLETRKVSAREN